MALTGSFPTEDASGLSIGDTRLILAGLVARAADGSPRLGVLPSHAGPLVTGTAGMAYSVGAHHAVTSRNGVGVELVANDGPGLVATTAAPGSNSRIDVIWERCRFDLYTDAGEYTPEFGVTQGTAGLTPSKPAIPAGASELAMAVVTSSDVATSTTVITQTHLYTAAAGGTVLVRNDTEMQAWQPHPGGRVYRVDTGQEWRFDGTVWRSVVGGLVLVRRVNLSSGTSVALDGVFTSEFRNYEIVADFNLAAASSLNFRLRNAGVDLSGSDYTIGRTWDSSTSARTTLIASGAATWTASGVSATRHRLALNVFGPAVADTTIISGKNIAVGGSPTVAATDISGSYGPTSAVDGIAFNPGQTVNAGSVSIYGCA